MHNRDRALLWLSAVVSFVAGLILVLKESNAGWFLIILGIVDIGISTRASQRLFPSSPSSVWLGLVGVSVLLVSLAVILGALLLLN